MKEYSFLIRGLTLFQVTGAHSFAESKGKVKDFNLTQDHQAHGRSEHYVMWINIESENEITESDFYNAAYNHGA